MTNNRYVIVAVFIGFLVLFALFGYQQGRPKPLREGIVWKVICGEGNSQAGLYREKMPEKPQPGQGGEYGVDMYGVLYPTCLVIRRPNSPDSHVEIIPFSKITCLEFGSGGVTIDK
jgi:hypothetical protein